MVEGTGWKTIRRDPPFTMNIINLGHSMKYENECVAMLFFPEEKIVTVQPEEEAARQLADARQNGSDYILTQLSPEGALLVQVRLAGQERTAEGQVPAGEPNPLDWAEHWMAKQMYLLLEELTGSRPSWGIMTGVRPIKMFRRQLERMSPEECRRFFAEEYLITPQKIDLAMETEQRESPLLRQVTPDSFSLYLSIPFCPTRCSYCSFVAHSIHTKKARDLLPRYVDLLCEEIAATAEAARRAGLRLDTVYYGGGTPTTLSAQQLDQVCQAVAEHFDLSSCREYTVEAGRPDTIDLEKLLVLKKHGVDRISINPQTLNDRVLEEIGRHHTAQQTIDAFHLARQAGFTNINMDLIAGLPTDTLESFRSTVDQVLALDPENVTVHTLSIKRSANYGSSPEARQKALESAQQVEAMVSYAQQQLMPHGLMPYYLYKQRNTLGNLENTGYCKPGCECRYNIYIMDEQQTILAVGGGAVTKLWDGSAQRLERVFNYKYPFEYIDRFDEVLRRKQKILDFWGVR